MRGTDIFYDLLAPVHAGERLVIIGANGCGKSSLLGVLHGDLSPDGQVHRPRGTTTHLVQQEDTFAEGATVAAVIRAAFADAPEHTQDAAIERFHSLATPPLQRSAVGGKNA